MFLPSLVVLLPALAEAALLPVRQPVLPFGKRQFPFSNETTIITSDVVSTDSSTSTPGISTPGISTTDVSSEVSTTGASASDISTSGVSTSGTSTSEVSSSDVSSSESSTGVTSTGVVSTTTGTEPSTTALAVITPDPATVSAEIVETIEGVTENTLYTTTDDDGSTTVVPVLFGAPCLIFCNDIGPDNGPGGILLFGIGEHMETQIISCSR